jgi:uncharacterized protein with ParB-like and HNH nuclease domain
MPEYQRPYEWNVDQAETLLIDIQDAIKEENDSYFLSSIVLARTEVKNEYEVIDGQQRLMTLTILLAVLRELFHLKEGVVKIPLSTCNS